jgi:hypothetical protein
MSGGERKDTGRSFTDGCHRGMGGNHGRQYEIGCLACVRPVTAARVSTPSDWRPGSRQHPCHLRLVHPSLIDSDHGLPGRAKRWKHRYPDLRPSVPAGRVGRGSDGESDWRLRGFGERPDAGCDSRGRGATGQGSRSGSMESCGPMGLRPTPRPPRGARLTGVTIGGGMIQDPNGDPNVAQKFRAPRPGGHARPSAAASRGSCARELACFLWAAATTTRPGVTKIPASSD